MESQQIDYKELANTIVSEASPVIEANKIVHHWLLALGVFVSAQYHGRYYVVDKWLEKQGRKADKPFNTYPEAMAYALALCKKKIEDHAIDGFAATVAT